MMLECQIQMQMQTPSIQTKKFAFSVTTKFCVKILVVFASSKKKQMKKLLSNAILSEVTIVV